MNLDYKTQGGFFALNSKSSRLVKFLGKLACVLGVLFVSIGYSWGQCGSIYVDGTNGNDANTGTETSPVKTLNKALTLFDASTRNHIKMTIYNYYESRLDV